MGQAVVGGASERETDGPLLRLGARSDGGEIEAVSGRSTREGGGGGGHASRAGRLWRLGGWVVVC